CPMTKEQKKIYLAYLAKAKKDIMNEIDDKGFERSQIKILSILTRLRQICCHPGMFIENYKGESGKLEILMELVKECLTSNHRILLFSQYTSMLAIIKKEFEKENIPYSYLDGSTKILDRKKVVTEFNEGKDSVLLISLKAGGTGLNLTGADTVIHFDPWWNPAVEDQATDRAYRIGQENKVQVYKLITYGTIEEKIYNLQMKKKNMIDAVIKPGETMIDKMSMEDIKELLTLK
ncbi:MAG: helicase-related protein, partial [Peptostreptococcales bacterium]